ncbi:MULTISPECIES: alternative ribosome rescue aminoacyl-tRNA hydrolase ArfB [unclassified Cupriavidus]|uniref:alternative ribosome rescue aminoacyl-tRNA hydrolase ArfB n=1 Tax=unclassified Cupriavidus TaxID=2640874 RepID=UPI00048E911A|nr:MULTISPECIES: alternative ribosome rescue aminoacyl-tRNA hydrolase ArfB [unclassified Cupriavidus]MBP0631973.1 aminoacyl-tRNA hydrolase [Cupriavidus sp. AcVe19-1a]MBP0635941.1 aminoacyl-tRNA hydrolase [Cupriavidus sp. AcVe19-6a]
MVDELVIPHHEFQITAIRAQGAGGQNINKVSNAVHLRYDVRTSSLPPDHKERLLALHDHRITRDGVVVIKAQQFRSLEQNRDEAVRRLHELVRSAATPPRVRRATRPTLASRQRRLEGKSQRSQVKALRGRVFD